MTAPSQDGKEVRPCALKGVDPKCAYGFRHPCEVQACPRVPKPPTDEKRALPQLAWNYARMKHRVDAILERDGSEDAAVTGIGVGISYLFAKEIAANLKDADEALQAAAQEKATLETNRDYWKAMYDSVSISLRAAAAKLNPPPLVPSPSQQFGRDMANKGERSCGVCGRSWTWVGRDGECGGEGPTMRGNCPIRRGAGG